MLTVRPAVAAALAAGRPVVALESTLIAHGLPFPTNLETARAAEAAVREAGAEPATIAVLAGEPVVGLTDDEVVALARATGVRKASRRDLAAAIAARATAATTVAATMLLAHRAGVRVFATGGIGGAHREPLFDLSADLVELARVPVAVVCAGAKSILDLPRTLELLETLGVPVVGYRCDRFPGFYLTDSGLPVSARVDDLDELARLCVAHWNLGGGGIVIAQPLPAADAVSADAFAGWLANAERLAADAGIRGPATTPFLLARLAELSSGATLAANRTLIVNNARLAGELAAALASP